MYLIAGLGNPGDKYENTRHNVGFHVIDVLADRMRTTVAEKKHFALTGRGVIGAERVILAKPQTYMNNSGQSLRAIADFYKIPPEDIIVISDDIDLEEGQLRIRLKGSAGGHNGLKSIIAHLGSQDFKRVRVGIGGKPEGWDLADYVLGQLKGDDRETMEKAYRTAADAVETMVTEGGEAAMTRFNKKPKKKKKAAEAQKAADAGNDPEKTAAADAGSKPEETAAAAEENRPEGAAAEAGGNTPAGA